MTFWGKDMTSGRWGYGRWIGAALVLGVVLAAVAAAILVRQPRTSTFVPPDTMTRKLAMCDAPSMLVELTHQLAAQSEVYGLDLRPRQGPDKAVLTKVGMDGVLQCTTEVVFAQAPDSITIGYTVTGTPGGGSSLELIHAKMGPPVVVTEVSRVYYAWRGMKANNSLPQNEAVAIVTHLVEQEPRLEDMIVAPVSGLKLDKDHVALFVNSRPAPGATSTPGRGRTLTSMIIAEKRSGAWRRGRAWWNFAETYLYSTPAADPAILPDGQAGVSVRGDRRGQVEGTRTCQVYRVGLGGPTLDRKLSYQTDRIYPDEYSALSMPDWSC